MTIREQVAEFHKVFGIKERTSPGAVSDDDVRYHLKMCLEETFELTAACFGGEMGEEIEQLIRAVADTTPIKVDLPKVVDALGDSDYVNESFRRALGVNGEPIAAAIHKSNMGKTTPCGDCGGTGLADYTACRRCSGAGRIVIKVAGKVQKPAGWTPPNIVGELAKQGWRDPSRRWGSGPLTSDDQLERLRHAVRDAETHGWDAGSIIRVVEAAK